MLEIVPFVLGPVQTNAYLIGDPETKEAAVIDPAWDGELILEAARSRGWRIAHLWYTHAHFDHIGGAAAIADASNPLPLVALHPADHALWRMQGGAALFGFKIDPGPEPTHRSGRRPDAAVRGGRIGGPAYPRPHSGHTILYAPRWGLLLRRSDLSRQRRPHRSAGWRLGATAGEYSIEGVQPAGRDAAAARSRSGDDRGRGERSNPFVGRMADDPF